MSINILMPALSPTMEKGTLSKWLKKEGDKIRSGDAVAEIETDKATMEVEAADEGILARIVVSEGTTDVAVNQVIAVLAEEGEDIAEVAKSDISSTSDIPSTSELSEKPEKILEEKVPSVKTADKPQPSVASVIGSSTRVFATPLARLLAKEKSLDLSQIKGSGPSGRIIAQDVKNASLSHPSTVSQSHISAGGAGQWTADQIKALYTPDSYEEVSLDGMRKTIAVRLLEAKTTIPHFYLSMDIELDALLALRTQINSAAPKTDDGKPAYKISVNDFVIKALALALQRIPEANAVWAQDRILRFHHSDIGVAVAIEGGLFTPVLRQVEEKSLTAISSNMKTLAEKARTRRLKPEEYQGGTIAVSNLGMYGIKNFSAIINPPHAAILAVGTGEERIIAKNGVPAVAQMMSVTLSCDHRVIDGALGAELLGAFRQIMEAPMTMLV